MKLYHRQRRMAAFAGALATVAAVVGVSVGCSSTAAHSDSPVNNSPKNGSVVDLGHGDSQGDGHAWKWCDGTTLVYQSEIGYSGGIAVIQNSPECK